MNALVYAIKEVFECLAAGCLMSPQSFILNVVPHRILLDVKFKRNIIFV